MKAEPSALARLARRNGFMDTQLGPHWSASFGGFSWRALEAYTSLVDAWYAADSNNREKICNALRALLPVFPPSERVVLKRVIWGLGYEGAIAELWPEIAPAPPAAE